mmetsp:Transcript_26679/g.61533  ORF Transcript_26679/g.61533 Transcript_26679/m.61533 type:complete len:197 (+) Transcript_26679:623-1213(+)
MGGSLRKLRVGELEPVPPLALLASVRLLVRGMGADLGLNASAEISLSRLAVALLTDVRIPAGRAKVLKLETFSDTRGLACLAALLAPPKESDTQSGTQPGPRSGTQSGIWESGRESMNERDSGTGTGVSRGEAGFALQTAEATVGAMSVRLGNTSAAGRGADGSVPDWSALKATLLGANELLRSWPIAAWRTSRRC